MATGMGDLWRSDLVNGARRASVLSLRGSLVGALLLVNPAHAIATPADYARALFEGCIGAAFSGRPTSEEGLVADALHLRPESAEQWSEVGGVAVTVGPNFECSVSVPDELVDVRDFRQSVQEFRAAQAERPLMGCRWERRQTEAWTMLCGYWPVTHSDGSRFIFEAGAQWITEIGGFWAIYPSTFQLTEPRQSEIQQ